MTLERLLGEMVENAAVLSEESLMLQQVRDEAADVFADAEADDDANLGNFASTARGDTVEGLRAQAEISKWQDLAKREGVAADVPEETVDASSGAADYVDFSEGLDEEQALIAADASVGDAGGTVSNFSDVGAEAAYGIWNARARAGLAVSRELREALTSGECEISGDGQLSLTAVGPVDHTSTLQPSVVFTYCVDSASRFGRAALLGDDGELKTSAAANSPAGYYEKAAVIHPHHRRRRDDRYRHHRRRACFLLARRRRPLQP